MSTIKYYIWLYYWKLKRRKDPYIDYLRISYGINGVGKTIIKEK